MKTRLISAAIAFSIFIPIYLMGGNVYNAAVFILSMIGLNEFINIKQTKKSLPYLVKFISFIMMTLLVFSSHEFIVFSIDLRVITSLFLVLLMPVVLYHEREIYSVNDAFFLIGGIFFLGISFNLIMLMRQANMGLLSYLFLITIFTDTYAYITGLLIGRNKLLESISPKKTLEGLVGGTFFGVMFSAAFYFVVIDSGIPIFNLLFMTTFLSILGQFGDLTFSAIKRYYGKKDFSNIMPGHGGVLDRLDSIIFVLLGFMFFISII